MGFLSNVESCRIKAKGEIDMGLQENMAAFIREVMKRNHKSLSEFSEELGISRNALYDYSTGEGNPTILTLEHIAEKLGVNPASIILGVLDLDRREILLLLMDAIQDVAELTEENRLRFADLFLEMVKLWDKE